MGTRRLILLALGLTFLAADSSAETTIIRPGPCAAQETYLLAGNSGALIRVEPDARSGKEDRAIVFRYQPTHGWASRRLLKRFDLQLDDGSPRIVNSGAFCRGVS